MRRRILAVCAASMLCLATTWPVGAMPAPAGGAAGPASAMPANATDPNKVPHYYGPYPNWVNSPQALADAVVTITAQPGDTGTGAAMMEAGSLMSDDEAQLATAADALIRGLDSSFRDRGLLA
jgi:hypothetical protein